MFRSMMNRMLRKVLSGKRSRNAPLDPASLRDAVRGAYSFAARQPKAKHPFPVGRRFAESVGYPAELVDSLPATAVDAFAGVSNVALFAEIPSGATVLDLGCGAGLDALIASKRAGPTGNLLGVDFSETMLERARQAAKEAGVKNVELRLADAERLPLADASIDVALVNGIFNLNPNRRMIFRELATVRERMLHLRLPCHGTIRLTRRLPQPRPLGPHA